MGSYWVLARSVWAPGELILTWCRWSRRLESATKPIYTWSPQLAAATADWLLALSAEM